LPNDQKVLDKILAQAPKGANAAKNRKDLRK
jgi:hypothetical protein